MSGGEQLVNLVHTDLKNFKAPDRLIVDVWAHNLHEELDKIMDIVDDYPYIAMDTEFPGVVARPIGCFKNSHDYHYQTLKCNGGWVQARGLEHNART